MDKNKKTLAIYIFGVIALAFLIGGIAGFFGSGDSSLNPATFIAIMLPLGVAVAMAFKEEEEESSEDDGDKDDKDGEESSKDDGEES